jgi:hypothetical protein
LRLPSATNPVNWSITPGFDAHIFGKNYYRATEIRDGSVRMIRGFRVEKNEIDAVNAKQDNSRIGSFNNSMAWLNYDPANRNSAKLGAKAVPTAGSTDWTADAAPCLSPDAIH